MRRLAALLALVLVPAAAAGTLRGSNGADLIVGTAAADRVLARGGADAVQAAFGGTDTVDCGAGLDIASVDAADRVTGCEVVARRLSVDPYRNADSQHETAVEPDSFAYGGTVVAVYQLGRREAGAAANIGTAASTDGGRTWTRATLPGITVNAQGPESAASDPAVAYDAVHGFWLAAVLTIAPETSGIYVARSTDGVHWAAPVKAATGPVLDKEWIACDNNAASPHRGRCYLEYTDDATNRVNSQLSDDGGATWSPPVRVTSILVGTQPVIQPNGTLVVVAGDYSGQKALGGQMVAMRSTDGGATFSRAVISDLHAKDNDPMRAIALPSVDVDSNGTIYAAWHDCRFRPGCTQNDIVVSTSTDGITWTAPARVPLAPVSSTLSAFITGLAADPAQPGRLGVVFAYYLPGTRRLGMGFTTSPDGGRTWSALLKLHAQPMNLTWLAEAEGGRMVGDYFSTSYVSGRVVPVFALATSPLNGRLREAIFAASLPAAGQRAR